MHILRTLVFGLTLVACGAKEEDLAIKLPPTPPSIVKIIPMGPAEPVEAFAKPTCSAPGYCVPFYRFRDDVDKAAVETLRKWLRAAQQLPGLKAIVIEWHTRGGELDLGMDLAAEIGDSKVPIHCVVDREAMSMGFGLLQACHHRYMTKRAQIMTHDVRWTGIGTGTKESWANHVASLTATSRAWAEHCRARMRVTAAQYRQHTAGGLEWFMNWEEALKVGAIDKAVPSVRHVSDNLRASLLVP